VGDKAENSGHEGTGAASQHQMVESVFQNPLQALDSGQQSAGLLTGFSSQDQEVDLDIIGYLDPEMGLDAFQLSWGYLDQLGKISNSSFLQKC
jgi:hypothetical protein